MNSALFSSKTEEWATPWEVFREWDYTFHFTLDVCATRQNAKCARYFTKADDGLSRSWAGEVAWMNPPYGREIIRWMHKAYNESRHATIVALVPSRTDTAWWHDYAMRGEIRFLRGRIRFVGAKHPAPFPSAIITFKPTL